MSFMMQLMMAVYQQTFGFELMISDVIKQRQYDISRKMMFAFVPVGLIFGMMNMMTQHPLMGLGDLIFAMALLYCGCYVRQDYLPWLAVLLGYSINILAFMDGAMENMAALGFMVMPFVYFPILGQKKSWMSLLVFSFILETMVWIIPQNVAYNFAQTQVILIVFMILSTIGSYLNSLSLTYQLYLEKKEARILRRMDDVKKESELESQAWQETINQLNDVVLVLDSAGYVLKSNHLAVDMYPSLAHARGMHWQGLLQGELAKSGEGIEVFPLYHQNFEQAMILDVNQRWLSMSFAPLSIQCAKKWAGVLICRDVTKHYQQEQQEAQQHIHLQALQQMKSVMTSSLPTPKILSNLMKLFLHTFQANRAWVLHENPWHDGMYEVVCHASENCFFHSILPSGCLNIHADEKEMIKRALQKKHVWIAEHPLGDKNTELQIIAPILSHLESKYWMVLDMSQQAQRWQDHDTQLFEEMAFRMANILDAWRLGLSLTWREDQYQQLVDNLPNGVFVLQEENVVFANEVALQMTGVDELQDFKGYRLSSFVPEIFKDKVKQCFQQAMASKLVPIIEIQIQDIYGHLTDIVLNASSIFYEGKVSLQLVLVDVTRQKKQHQQLLELSKKNTRMAQKMIDLQEEERRIVAQNLHDDSGQLLTALSMNLSSVKMNLEDEALCTRIAESEAIVQRIFTSIRSTLNTLNPTHIETLGLSNALHSAVDAWSACHRIAVILHMSDNIDSKPCIQSTAIYRIVQEALTNIAKYAKTDEVKIDVYEDQNAAMILEIFDQGCGFDVEKADKQGFGLLGMKTRAEYVGGTLHIHSEIGKGTHIYGKFLARG